MDTIVTILQWIAILAVVGLIVLLVDIVLKKTADRCVAHNQKLRDKHDVAEGTLTRLEFEQLYPEERLYRAGE